MCINIVTFNVVPVGTGRLDMDTTFIPSMIVWLCFEPVGVGDWLTIRFVEPDAFSDNVSDPEPIVA